MKRTTQIAFLFGLGLAIALIAWLGVGPVVSAIGAAGWGVFWLPVIYLVPLAFAASSWRLLIPPSGRPGTGAGVVATWIGLGANWLLPVAQIGGELIKARFIIRRGTPADSALASVIVDKTLQVVTQIVFALAGALVFATSFTGKGVVIGAVGGVVPLGVGVWLFYRLQRKGAFGRLTDKLVQKVEHSASDTIDVPETSVNDQLDLIYAQRRTVIVAAVLRLMFRCAMILETYVILHLLGHPVGLIEVFVIESLGQAVRAGSFLIPAGIGVQEVAFAALAKAVGLPVEIGVALSLCKRVRELTVGLPALLVWQLDEGRGAFRKKLTGGAQDNPAT